MLSFVENVNLSELSNYRIGGPARFFFEAKNTEEVAWAIKEAKNKGLAVFVLGGGTNLLIDDEGWNGLVLKPSILFLNVEGEKISAGAGVLIPDLLDLAVRKSLSGLEWAGGLPGTLGGAIRGNAGCFGGEIKDVIESVQSFDSKEMKIIERNIGDCDFDYRTSIFKRSGTEIVLSATLRCQKGDKAAIKKAIDEKIERRNKNHPLEYPNVGSIFQNVRLSAIHEEGSGEYEMAIGNSSLEFKGSIFSVKNDPFPVISAAKLISESGLRGVSFGGAMVSPKHPNFIVNVMEASASDVKSLIELVRSEVKNKFGLELEEEVMEV